MPDTKPFSVFDADGVCSACRSHELKNQAERRIDWADRAAQFNDWFYTALSQPSSYMDPAVGRVATTPVFTAPAPLP